MGHSIKELRDMIRSKHHTPVFSRVNRWLAPYLIKPLMHMPVTANNITLFMIFIGVIAAVLFSFGDMMLNIIGVVLFALYYNLDYVDGAIAKLKKQYSNVGIYLDLLSHGIVEPLVFMGGAIGLYFTFGNVLYLFAGMFVTVAFLMSHDVELFITKIKHRKGIKLTEQEVRYNEVPKWKDMGFVKKIKHIVNNMYTLPIMSVIFVVCMLSGVLPYFYLWYGLTMPLMAVVYILYGVKAVPSN